MKRAGVVVFLLLFLMAALWAGVTLFVGMKTEERYHELLQRTSQTAHIKLRSESYKRGFLKSEARMVIELPWAPTDKASVGDRPLQLTLAQDIVHGPFLFGDSMEAGKPFQTALAVFTTRVVPDTGTGLSEIFQAIPELESARDRMVITLDGDVNERLVFPPIHRTFGKQDPVDVDWKGFTFRARYSADLKKAVGSLTLPGLRASGKDMEVNAGNMEVTFDLHEGVDGLSLGEVAFATDEITATKKRGEPLHDVFLQGAGIKSSARASEGDNIQWTLALHADRLGIDKVRYGPCVFELQLGNLDALSLARFQEAVRSFQARTPPPSAEEMQMRMLALYGEWMPTVLKKSPWLEISRFDVKTPEGDFSGRAKVAVDGKKAGPGQNLVMLLGALSAQAEVRIAEPLVRSISSLLKESQDSDRAPSGAPADDDGPDDIDKLVKELVAQGVVVKENGALKASAGYQSGQISLNGRSFPLGDLFR